MPKDVRTSYGSEAHDGGPWRSLPFGWTDFLVVAGSAVLVAAPLLLLTLPRFPFFLWKVAENLWAVAAAAMFAGVIARRIRPGGFVELGGTLLSLGFSSRVKFAVSPMRPQIWRAFLRPSDWRLWTFASGLLLLILAFALFGNPLSGLAASRIKVSRPVFFFTDRSADSLAEETNSRPAPDVASTVCVSTNVCASVIFGEALVYLPVDRRSDAPPRTELVTSSPTPQPQISYMSKDEFYRRLSQDTGESPNHDAFLFVHGFRNSFQDALDSAAGLAINLKFAGAPIAFSWPAEKGSLTTIWRNYGGDSRRVLVGANDLAIVLPELQQKSGAQTFHVIAHSIGSTLTAQAELQAYPQLCRPPPVPFANTILAAPDVTPELFEQQVTAIECASGRLTIYFSHGDIALLTSRLLQEGRRIGAGTPPIPGADVIDATEVDPAGVGHSYVFTGPVLHDIFSLLQMPSSRAIDRFGIVEDVQTGVYRLTIP